MKNQTKKTVVAAKIILFEKKLIAKGVTHLLLYRKKHIVESDYFCDFTFGIRIVSQAGEELESVQYEAIMRENLLFFVRDTQKCIFCHSMHSSALKMLTNMVDEILLFFSNEVMCR